MEWDGVLGLLLMRWPLSRRWRGAWLNVGCGGAVTTSPGGLHIVLPGMVYRKKDPNSLLFLGPHLPSVMSMALYYRPTLWHIAFPTCWNLSPKLWTLNCWMMKSFRTSWGWGTCWVVESKFCSHIPLCQTPSWWSFIKLHLKISLLFSSVKMQMQNLTPQLTR